MDLSPGTVTGVRQSITLGIFLAVCWVTVLVGRGMINDVGNMFPTVLPDNPFFITDHLFQLYVATPIIIVATIVVLLAPGLLAANLARPHAGLAETVVRAFGLAFGIRLLLHAGVMVTGYEWSGTGFIIADLITTASLWVFFHVRVSRGQFVAWPFAESRAAARTCIALAIPVIILLPALPFFFWQDMNGDGNEALLLGHSLMYNFIPRFPGTGGLGGLGGGVISMDYPVHWFIMLFGMIDAAARLPILLYAPVIFMALVALIEWRSARGLGMIGELSIAVVVVAFVTTLGFWGRYNPYIGDFASPAALEAFTVLSLCGLLLYHWRGERAAFLGFVLLAYFARPTTLIVLALLGVAALLFGGRERSKLLARTVLGFATCVIAFIIYEKIYLPYASGTGGVSYAASSVLKRYRYLQFTDIGRLAYWAIPVGFVPALALLAFRRQDLWSRILVIVCLGYCLAFYFPAFVALHHFAPLMVLPAVVFWRMTLTMDSNFWPAIALAGAIAALPFALPGSNTVFRGFRDAGMATEYRVGRLYGSWAEHRAALANQAPAALIYGRPSSIKDPSAQLSISPIVLLHYATLLPHDAPPRYIIQSEGAPPPAGFIQIGAVDRMVVFAHDPASRVADRAQAPAELSTTSPFFIPKEVLFPHYGIPAGAYDLDLRSLPFLKRWKKYLLNWKNRA
jgi:hypothetical protein